jgi:putative endonuclease
MTQSKQWFLYALRCADETLYTGVTTDLGRRVSEHSRGQGARYTAGRRPVTLIGAWRFADRSAAQRAEAQFRRLPRREKLQRIARQLPFAGSAFCIDETVADLLSPIYFCRRCGGLLGTHRRPKDNRPRLVCTICGRLDCCDVKPCADAVATRNGLLERQGHDC